MAPCFDMRTTLSLQIPANESPWNWRSSRLDLVPDTILAVRIAKVISNIGQRRGVPETPPSSILVNVIYITPLPIVTHRTDGRIQSTSLRQGLLSLTYRRIFHLAFLHRLSSISTNHNLLPSAPAIFGLSLSSPKSKMSTWTISLRRRISHRTLNVTLTATLTTPPSLHPRATLNPTAPLRQRMSTTRQTMQNTFLPLGKRLLVRVVLRRALACAGMCLIDRYPRNLRVRQKFLTRQRLLEMFAANRRVPTDASRPHPRRRGRGRGKKRSFHASSRAVHAAS